MQIIKQSKSNINNYNINKYNTNSNCKSKPIQIATNELGLLS